jgi:hypothetical protein
MATGIPESKILKPRDPAITDENEWPIFNLKNVRVTDKAGRLVNLLDADASKKLTVVGNIDALQSTAKRKYCE